MSSHHIVRENQEPALLIEDFKALSEEYLGQLLEWSPTILTNVECIDYLISKDIKVDVLYGCKESFAQEEVKHIAPQTTFLDDALAYLIEHNFKAVNILLEKILPEILQFASQINIVVFAKDIRYAVIRSHFEKWKAKGDIMVLNVSDIKSFTGIKYLHDDIFEVEQDGFVRIEMNTDQYVFVGEEIQ